MPSAPILSAQAERLVAATPFPARQPTRFVVGGPVPAGALADLVRAQALLRDRDPFSAPAIPDAINIGG